MNEIPYSEMTTNEENPTVATIIITQRGKMFHVIIEVQVNRLVLALTKETSLYVDRLTVKNFRCYSKASFLFRHRSSNPNSDTPQLRLPNINLLIGNNGTGKTTAFQALTIAALKSLLSTSASGFRTERMIRHRETSAEAIASLLLSELDIEPNFESSKLDGRFQKRDASGAIKRHATTEFLEMRGQPAGWTENLFSEAHPGLFLAAYGANRRTERPEAYNERLRSVRYQRIASLFEPHIGLIPLSLAYSQCNARGRWDEVVSIVNQLLAPPVRLTEDIEDSVEPLFDFDGVPLPGRILSDGYRLFTGWLIDLLTHLARVLPDRYALSEAAGIVIVDEVDLFLSPSWQRTVLESLSTTFPNIQWLCSTHSPLVAGSLENENIHILEHIGPYTTGVRRPSDVFEGKSVETVLAELFGVYQSRSPELQRQLGELAEKAMAGDVDASIEYLRRLNTGTAMR